jgi:hypothetical protein
MTSTSPASCRSGLLDTLVTFLTRLQSRFACIVRSRQHRPLPGRDESMKSPATARPIRAMRTRSGLAIAPPPRLLPPEEPAPTSAEYPPPKRAERKSDPDAARRAEAASCDTLFRLR